MKDFFTKEDGKYVHHTCSQCRHSGVGNKRLLSIEDANRLINERFKKGYTSLDDDDDDDICDTISPKKMFCDTHEALVLLRPIEEEKPECDHFINMGWGKFKQVGQYDFKVKIIEGECPKCGVNLQ